ncbi:MAG: SDR family NAD(P)-dependent oxidoreductase [Chitinophagales bacterium]
MGFAGRVALVTGAARGIGFEITGRLAAAGCRVILVDVNRQGVEQAAAVWRERGWQADGLAADLGQVEEIRALIERVRHDFGRLDILVNNAGICPNTPPLEITPEEWDKVLTVNLKSVFFMCQATAPLMIAQGYGRIINISSIAGKMGALVAGCHYTASKAGVLGVTKVFARHLAASGVTVNAVAPGTIDTAMTADWSSEQRAMLTARIPVGRLGVPADIAQAVLFLAAEESGFITGATLDVNGGALMD